MSKLIHDPIHWIEGSPPTNVQDPKNNADFLVCRNNGLFSVVWYGWEEGNEVYWLDGDGYHKSSDITHYIKINKP